MLRRAGAVAEAEPAPAAEVVAEPEPEKPAAPAGPETEGVAGGLEGDNMRSEDDPPAREDEPAR